VHSSSSSPGHCLRRLERLILFIPLLAAACALKDGRGGDGGSIVASLGKKNRRPGPTLQTSTTQIDLGCRSQSSATFDVWNMGSGTLDWTTSVDAGNGPAGWLSATPASGSSSGEHDTIDVEIARDLLAPGAFTGLVHVDAGTQRIDVRIGAQVVAVATSSTDVAFGYGVDPIALEVWNSGFGVLSYNVTSKPAWLEVAPTTGTSAGPNDHQTVQLTADRSGLAAGHYAGTLEIDPDADQGSHSAQVNVSLDVGVQGGVLAVTPADGFQGSGFTGGPFAPAGIDYLLTNSGDADLDWSASSSQSWMDLSATSGTLAPAASTTVTASIDQAVAATLPAGTFHADLAFTNVTNGRGDATRGADLTVNDPGLKAVIYATPNPMKIAPYTTLFSGLDSTSTSSTVVRWNWDFGDGGDGNPQTDEEMLVVHRYDNPGTYTVALTVTDANGSTNTTSTSVVVTAFSGRTFYVSSSAGSDSNDGSSARPWKTLDYAFSKMASNRQNQPDKLLLACGDTWTFSGDIGPPKPSILDCYGSGAQPIIEFTTLNGIGWYGGSGGTPDTWGYSPIVQNLHFRYAGGKNGSDALVNPFIRGSTFRNCTVENGGIIGSLQHEGLVIEGCTVSWALKLGVYSSGDTVVLRHSTFTGSGTDNTFHHQIYLNNGTRWLLEDCVFDGANTGLNNDAAKLNGGNGVVVRRSEARGSRNGFDAGRNLEESNSGPADNYLYDECISHDNGFGGQAAGLMVSWIRHLTVRNCVFYNHHPSGGGCGAIWLWDSNDADNNVFLYNNVFYSNTIPDIYFSSALYNLVMRNNVFMRDASGTTGSYLKLNDPNAMLPLIDSDHNVYYWTGKRSSDPGFGMNSGDANLSFDAWRNTDGKDPNAAFGDPMFTDPVHLDFTLQTGSPAIDVGQVVPIVSRDKNWVPRPKGAADDAGVFER
jgi:PKD repeat protein